MSNIKTKPPSKDYDKGWDTIFGKNKKEEGSDIEREQPPMPQTEFYFHIPDEDE